MREKAFQFFYNEDKFSKIYNLFTFYIDELHISFILFYIQNI
jgi:hypothetical protein